MAADDALTHANPRAPSDPTPDRASRDRPYVLRSTRAAETAPPVALRGRTEALRAAAIAALSRSGSIAHPAIANHRPACR